MIILIGNIGNAHAHGMDSASLLNDNFYMSLGEAFASRMQTHGESSVHRSQIRNVIHNHYFSITGCIRRE